MLTSSPSRIRRPGAFTLIELLTVVTIIAILSTIMLAVISGAQNSAKRKRAAGEIEAMSLALEKYKAEFGEYPGVVNGSSDPETQAKCLYQAVSGDGGDMIDGVPDASASNGTAGSATDGLVFLDTAIYDKEKARRNDRGFVHPRYYVQDPWGNPYRYQRGGDGTETRNPTFDLWSIGTDETGNEPEKWISNW